MWLHPSKTDEVESNIVAEVQKRQSATGIASNDWAKTSWWRSRSGNLSTIKSRVNDLFKQGDSFGYGWVMADVIDTNFLGSYLASNAVPVFTSATKASALARWGLPTNYLEYTPWRDLSGVGGYTNDIANVGRPHGTTNATTAAGGTNYPAGRTRWYTTDYGWDGLAIILPNLWARVPNEISYGIIATHGSVFQYVGWDDFNTNGYDATYSAAASRYGPPAWPYSGISIPGQYAWMERYATYRSARLFNTGCELNSKDADSRGKFSTNYITSGHYYLAITNGGIFASLNDNAFDTQAYGWPVTNVIEYGGILTSNSIIIRLAETNLPPANWTVDPPENEKYARGWNLHTTAKYPLILRYEF
jgi:hypothetical protein